MTVEEKIKQAFVEDTCIVYGRPRHWRYDGPDYARTRCEGIIELYEEKTLPAIQEKILKILSGYSIVEKQKLKELADLLKNRPKPSDFHTGDDAYDAQGYREKSDFWFEGFEKKFVEAFEHE